MVDHEGLLGCLMTPRAAARMLAFCMLDKRLTDHDRERLVSMWNEDVKRNAAQRGR